MTPSKPHSVQYSREPTGGGAGDGEDEQAAGSQRRVGLGEESGALGGQEVPERAEAHGQVERRGEGEGAGVGPYPADGGSRARIVTEPGRGLGEHARAEVDPGHPLLAHLPQHPHPGPGAAAEVDAPTERAERPYRPGHRVQHPLRRTERRVVELGREQVVAVLDGGERLDGEFAKGRALRGEHHSGA